MSNSDQLAGVKSDNSSGAISKRILVVDDDPDTLEGFRKVLAKAGFVIDVAVDGAKAKARIEKERFDVIVTDVTMPHVSGLEFLRAVREYDVDVPVILVTGQPDLASAVEGIEHGAFRYLAKPVESEVLIATVRQASRFHRMASLKREALEIVGINEQWLGDRATLDVRFRRALEQLWIAYQPIVSWKDRTVFGYEALVRSGEPTLKNPAELFAVAERLGRLQDLGRSIRNLVAAAANQVPGGTRLFVNVHPEELNDFELLSSTAPLSGIAKRVVLEITERSSLDQVKDAQARIAKLRKLGFTICVDDLGAGYAGLSCFSRLEPDIVKLDISLIRGIDASMRMRSVVRSMLQLAGRDLGMLVICEGVETAAERDTLALLGADLLQGYLFARPNREFVQPSW